MKYSIHHQVEAYQGGLDMWSLFSILTAYVGTVFKNFFSLELSIATAELSLRVLPRVVVSC